MIKKIALVSLGCARNLVDSELILGTLKKSGYKIAGSPSGSDVTVVNTCAFIEDAKKESIDEILELIELKEKKKLKYLLVVGCLSQRYAGVLKKEFPEIDGFAGVDAVQVLPGMIKKLARGGRPDIIINEPRYLHDDKSPRLGLTPVHYSYVKVSEGCSHKCSFCIIPRIRGRHRSRNPASIIREAKDLVARGAKELDIIGQDTTLYGRDLPGKHNLAGLLRDLSRQSGAKWIRLLYTHPAHFTDELISVIAGEKNICKYIDLPIQHINDGILRRMGRGSTGAGIRRLISHIRSSIPGVALRTSVIVGFPGESRKNFRELLDFIKEVKFERLGAFVYSAEEGTAASRFDGSVPADEKAERWDMIMGAQRDVSAGINAALVGRQMSVLIDEKVSGEDDLFTGRSYMDAPEIDGNVFVKGHNIRRGDMVEVEIADGYEYDLVGKEIKRRR